MIVIDLLAAHLYDQVVSVP